MPSICAQWRLYIFSYRLCLADGISVSEFIRATSRSRIDELRMRWFYPQTSLSVGRRSIDARRNDTNRPSPTTQNATSRKAQRVGYSRERTACRDSTFGPIIHRAPNLDLCMLTRFIEMHQEQHKHRHHRDGSPSFARSAHLRGIRREFVYIMCFVHPRGVGHNMHMKKVAFCTLRICVDI